MRTFRCPVSTEMLLKHLGRGALIVVRCTVVLVGRLLVWLVRGIGWLLSRRRATDG